MKTHQSITSSLGKLVMLVLHVIIVFLSLHVIRKPQHLRRVYRGMNAVGFTIPRHACHKAQQKRIVRHLFPIPNFVQVCSLSFLLILELVIILCELRLGMWMASRHSLLRGKNKL